MLKQRPSQPSPTPRGGPPHGPTECLVLAAWLLLLTAAVIAAAELILAAIR